MKKNLILLAVFLGIAGCATEPRVEVYGDIPNRVVVVAQVCMRDTMEMSDIENNAEIEVGEIKNLGDNDITLDNTINNISNGVNIKISGDDRKTGKMPDTINSINNNNIKANKLDEVESIRYSILVRGRNFIRFSGLEKSAGNYYFYAPLMERRLMRGFFLPLSYEKPQNFGYMWDVLEIPLSASQWTNWLEPQYTIEDISYDFKKDNGLVGKKPIEKSNVSPFVVRFKEMHMDDYIQDRVKKKDVVKDCVAQPLKKSSSFWSNLF